MRRKNSNIILKQLIQSVLFCLLITSCNYNSCSESIGIKLDYHLFTKVKINGYNYCELVNKALKGDEKALLYLTRVRVADGATYQHGAVMIELIEHVSEEKFMNIIQEISFEDQSVLYYSYLRAGLEYTNNPKYINKTSKEAFPLFSLAFQ